MIKKYLISVIIINILIFPYLSLAQTEPLIDDAFEELSRNAKPVGETFWQKSWQDFLTAWKIVFGWIKNFWDLYLSNWFSFIWEKLVSILGKEVEQRRPEIEQEFIKETEEMKQDIPKTTQTLWQRLQELIQ